MDKKIKKLSPLTESTFYILLILKRPLHGYGIIKEVEDLTKGRLVLATGTLYGAIQNLIKHNLIALISENITAKSKKEYIITEIGEELLNYEIRRLKKMIRNAKKVNLYEENI